MIQSGEAILAAIDATLDQLINHVEEIDQETLSKKKRAHLEKKIALLSELQRQPRNIVTHSLRIPSKHFSRKKQ